MGGILNIETSAYVCSVVLSKGEEVVAIKENHEDKSHAEMLTVYVEEMLKEQKIQISELDAIAISKGPGSYTGLRIGVSAAKGLCYGVNKPLISICSLQAMANGASLHPQVVELEEEGGNILLCPMIDARRMEVYTAIYNTKMETVKDISAIILGEGLFGQYLEKNKIIFFGNGSEKAKDIIRHRNAIFIDDFHPSARFMISLAYKSFKNGDFEDTAYFEPFYLKDFVPTTPKKNILK